jgi:hypothetical protein
MRHPSRSGRAQSDLWARCKPPFPGVCQVTMARYAVSVDRLPPASLPRRRRRRCRSRSADGRSTLGHGRFHRTRTKTSKRAANTPGITRRRQQRSPSHRASCSCRSWACGAKPPRHNLPAQISWFSVYRETKNNNENSGFLPPPCRPDLFFRLRIGSGFAPFTQPPRRSLLRAS